MSEIRVDKIISHAGNSAPDFPQGANLSGVTTVSSMKVGSGITADSSGVNVTGIVTASGFVGGVTGNVTGSSSPTVKINDGATEKGYIGFNGNDPFIGRKDGVGLAFQNNKVRPVDGDDGSASNNTVDLGEPTYKFKDLHLAGDASIAGSISGVSSVTATTFYGSGAGLSGVPGGLDSIDRWHIQGNDSPIDGTGVYQKMIMRTGANNCGCGTWYFSARDMSTRPFGFPNAIGAGVSFYSQESGYTSNTDCWSGTNLLGVEASAGIVTFPSTGTWQITWDIVACVCTTGRLQFGIECTANIGAATTVWGSIYPHLWNFCKIQEPHYCDTGNRCCGIKPFYFDIYSGSSVSATYTRQIEAYVSVANTNQTGVRFSWGRDSHYNWLTAGVGWTYKKVSSTAPW